MARKRGRKGKAWGNALGGFRTQKRNAFGQFGAGTPVKRGKKAAFTSGGTPRYYAPGGKTYSTNGFSNPRPSKAQRRKAGYEASLARKAEQQKKVRRRRMAVGAAVGAAVIVGGALAYKNSGKGSGGGPAAPRMLNAGGGTGPINPGGGLMGKIKRQQRSRRSNPTVGTHTSQARDNGYSPATAALAITAGGTVANVAKNVADAGRSATDLSRQVRAIGQDGVSEDHRHTPSRQSYAPSVASQFPRLPAIAASQADPRFEQQKGLVSLTKNPQRPTSAQAVSNLRADSVRGQGGQVKGHRGFLDDDANDYTPEQRRRSDTYGDPIANTKPAKSGGDYGSGTSNAMDARITKESSAQDRRAVDREVAAYRIGPNAGRQVRSTGKAVRINAAEDPRRTTRAITGPGPWTAGNSDNLDATIRAERNRTTRRKVSSRTSEAFPSSNKDNIVYQDGKAVDRTNFNAEKFATEANLIAKTNRPNPFYSGKYTEEDDGFFNAGKAKRPVSGQKVPGSMSIPKTTPVAKDAAGEKKAAEFLDAYEAKIAAGLRPGRSDRELYKFLTGGSNTYRRPPADLVKNNARKNNRNARDRARRNGVN